MKAIPSRVRQRFNDIRDALMSLEHQGVALPHALTTSEELEQFAVEHQFDAVVLKRFFSVCGFTPPYRPQDGVGHYRNRTHRF